MSSNQDYLWAESPQERPALKLAALMAAILCVHLVYDFVFPSFKGPDNPWQDFKIGIMLSQPMLVAFAAAFLPPPRIAWLGLGAFVVLLLGVASQVRGGVRGVDATLVFAIESVFIISTVVFMAVRFSGWEFRNRYIATSAESDPRFSMRTLFIVVTISACSLGLMRAVGGSRGRHVVDFLWACAVFSLLGLGPAFAAWLMLAAKNRYFFGLMAIVSMPLSVLFCSMLGVTLRGPSAWKDMPIHLSIAELGALASTLLSLLPIRATPYRLARRYAGQSA